MGGGDTEGFARAIDPRPFVFPDDHGPHPEFRTEWWYFTGNLSSEADAEFGVQLTIFRHALRSEHLSRDSKWGTRDIWFAHFAVGDASKERFEAFERFERSALGLAGARAKPFAAWVGDWRVESVDPQTTFPIRLIAADRGVTLDLVVKPVKPVVLQGDRGLSQKGPEQGNASFYYSMTRLAAHGTVGWGDIQHSVTGEVWFDREWSTSALSEGQAGWDWFAIQLDDGRELMLYRMRREDGTTDPHNSGVLVDVDGSTRPLGPEEVEYQAGRRWASSRPGVEYPVEWTLLVNSLDLELEVRPMLDDSELVRSVHYWEGAIRVTGREAGQLVAGKGFLEMTGYDRP
jgi:predicted secreted hydrolase